MKEVIVYGPPAVGKLTVATELAEQTGYKLFHNHLTVDLVSSLYELWTPEFWEALDETRALIFKMAALDKINLIFTFVYEEGTKDAMIKRYMDIYEENGGEICLVQLTTNPEELKKRVINPSRKKFQKMSDPLILESYMASANLFAKIPDRESLIIDTTTLLPNETAKIIVDHYNLIRV